LLNKIFSFFKRDYFKTKDGEQRTKEDIEEKIEETRKDCGEYYSLCVMQSGVKVSQYDVYVGVCFPEAALELLQEGLHLNALNTEVFESKNLWIKRVIFTHTLRQGFYVWQALGRRNDEELFVHTHYPAYSQKKEKKKDVRFSKAFDHCLQRVEDQDPTICVYCLTDKGGSGLECEWHKEMEKLRKSVQERKLESKFSCLLLGDLSTIDWSGFGKRKQKEI
jgi:hypothetical protein